GSAGGFGAIGAACSSNSTTFDTDGGATSDGSVSGDGSSNGGHDGSGDTSANDTGSHDAGADAVANCSNITGEGGIASQNGGQGKECVVAKGQDGGYVTACKSTGVAQTLGKGVGCCPGDTHTQCLPGLECLGPDCTQGGPKTARCAPHCCKDDDSVCGQSPE